MTRQITEIENVMVSKHTSITLVIRNIENNNNETPSHIYQIDRYFII